jgi:hypothetical protein
MGNNQLTQSDYITILKFYNVPFNETTAKNVIKTLAEDILANKLCKCIKKIQKKSKTLKEARSIAICKTSVLHKKGLQDFTFSCKKKPHFLPKKNTTIKLIKRKTLIKNK